MVSLLSVLAFTTKHVDSVSGFMLSLALYGVHATVRVIFDHAVMTAALRAPLLPHIGKVYTAELLAKNTQTKVNGELVLV
jgi:hypothetical protein